MSTKVSTGITLSSDFYLKNFYQANRNARKTSGRKELTKNELSYEDARALKRAISKLGNFSYTDSDNIDNVKSTIQAFADTYNNAMDSSTANKSAKLSHYGKQLKSMANKYKDELSSIGISIEKDGTLSVSELSFSNTKIDKLKKVFSKDDSDFVKDFNTIAKRMRKNSYETLYEEMTGNGGRINITL